MTSVSAHGGLVHVTLRVRSLTVKGLSLLMRNSPKLTTLGLSVFKEDEINIMMNYKNLLAVDLLVVVSPFFHQVMVLKI